MKTSHPFKTAPYNDVERFFEVRNVESQVWPGLVVFYDPKLNQKLAFLDTCNKIGYIHPRFVEVEK